MTDKIIKNDGMKYVFGGSNRLIHTYTGRSEYSVGSEVEKFRFRNQRYDLVAECEYLHDMWHGNGKNFLASLGYDYMQSWSHSSGIAIKIVDSDCNDGSMALIVHPFYVTSDLD